LADSNGEDRRKTAQLESGEEFLGVGWAPNDAQLLLLRHRVRLPSDEVMLETRDLQGRLSSTLVEDSRLQIQGASGFCWTRDGRILYSLLEEAPNHSSIWSITVDPQTGLPRDKPALVVLDGSIAEIGTQYLLTLKGGRLRNRGILGEHGSTGK
jgi:hypothetical protein